MIKKINLQQNPVCSEQKLYSRLENITPTLLVSLVTFRRSEHGADIISYSVLFSFPSLSHPILLMKINADIYWKLGPGPPNVRMCGHSLTFTVNGVHSLTPRPTKGAMDPGSLAIRLRLNIPR